MRDADPIKSCLPKDSETARLLQHIDWAATPLGPIASWPEPLRAALGVCMNSRFPMFIWWGPTLVNIYNDAYSPILGRRHPAAFGRPAREAWHEIWDVLGPQAQAVMERGEATWNERVRLGMERNGFVENTWFTWSYSPIPDAHGGVGGVFCACYEDTPVVLAERERDLLLEELEYERGQLAQAFEQSPALIVLTRGPANVIELANDRVFDLLDGRPLLGLPLLEAVPEAAEISALLDHVASGAETVASREIRLAVQSEQGVVDVRYLDFTLRARRVAGGSIAGVFVHAVDVTARRLSEARDRFFLRLEEAVRPLTDAAEITATFARILGEHLQADRCAYADIEPDANTFNLTGDYTRGVPSIVGRYTLDAFGEHYASLIRRGEVYRVDDIDRHTPAPADLDPYRQTGIRAVISVPVMKGGRVVAGMGVHQSVPRAWTDEEVELTRRVANRCWESLERARVERELRHSESRYRAALDATSNIVWNCAPTGEMLSPQPGWEAFTGQTPEQRYGFGWVAAVHPDDVDRTLAQWNGTVSAERRLVMRHRLRRHDGVYRMCEVRAVPVRDEDGAIREWVGTHTDVSEQVAFEHSLQESEARFRSMADSAPVMIWLTGADGRLEYANARWAEFTGQSLALALGEGWLDATDPADSDRVRATLAQAHAAQSGFSLDYGLTRADGMRRWCVSTGSPRRSADGAFAGFVGSVIDITERKQVEDALTAEKRVLELIATGSPLRDVLETLAMRLESQSGDGMLCSVMLVSEDGRSLLEGVAPSLPEAYRRASNRLPIAVGARACGSAAAQRRTVVCADIARDPRWDGAHALAAKHGLASCTSNPILGSDGRVLGTMALYYRKPRIPAARDMDLVRLGTHLAGIVIEKHQLDERLRGSLESEQQARMLAERANRMKDEFLATLSHELRSPLNAILGWVSILRLRSGLPVEVIQGVDVIERNARSQAQIIEDLLDMSSIISGKIALDMQRVDIADLVLGAVETAMPTAQARGLTLHADVEPDARCVIEGDPGRLQQIMWNLLTNAVKFTPTGGSVRVHVRRVERDIEIEVRDSGAGIETAFLPHVFERFRQADASTTRRYGGLGLGLSIVRSLAELHHGSVRAESAGPGQGASFVLTLPLPEDVHGEPGGARGAGNAPKLEGVRVLVVDDDPDARLVTGWLLEGAGARVVAADGAGAALEHLAREDFDVLVSDIGMPGMDGYELMRRVRGGSVQPAIPAIALTAYVRPQDRVLARDAGFHGHLGKPVDAQALLETLETLRLGAAAAR